MLTNIYLIDIHVYLSCHTLCHTFLSYIMLDILAIHLLLPLVYERTMYHYYLTNNLNNIPLIPYPLLLMKKSYTLTHILHTYLLSFTYLHPTFSHIYLHYSYLHPPILTHPIPHLTHTHTTPHLYHTYPTPFPPFTPTWGPT